MISDSNREKWIKKFGAENVYNKHCSHLCTKEGNYSCKLGMDMSYCSNDCVYATNSKLSNTVDQYGRANGVKGGL